MITIDDQIRCVNREIGLRKKVYRRLVATDRMSTETAKEETETMEAVLETLKKVKVAEDPQIQLIK